MDYLLNPMVAAGTQVVTNADIQQNATLMIPKGSVGIIVKAPADVTHAYYVRFNDETEVAIRRHEFTIRKHYQNPTDTPTIDLYPYVIYRCVIGSRVYGLDHDASDTDRRGIYLPPAELHWSLFGVPEQLERPETQEAYWELQKFVMLALKANPNILECLYTPLIEHSTDLAQELLTMREIFLSQMIYQTYNGYVMSQFRKIEQDMRNQGVIRWKHAMHLIRLLLGGIIALREGYIAVRVEAYRDELLAIRRQEWTWEAVNQWRLALHREFETAYTTTKLPERPDYERANAFLVLARRRML